MFISLIWEDTIVRSRSEYPARLADAASKANLFLPFCLRNLFMPDMVEGTVSIGAADAHAAIGEKTRGVKNAAENNAIHVLLNPIEILILLRRPHQHPT
ncbi:hypothetical protein [Bifidobacterium moukalabense]|uniref:hypothetical protein n=1 Tax=Bifidobacterium moukalabense TaxID=1333651 RepID=UPI001FCE99F2|nr:hypothetical protein [Bifidobacterium moukalabense]